MRKKIVAFGEVMLRLSPNSAGERIPFARDFLVEPGGAESNVAAALSLLGEPVKFVTKLPDNCLAWKILKYLSGAGVDISCVSTGGERVGLYWTETGAGVRPYTVHYDRQGSSFCDARFGDFDWKTIFSDACWLHTSGISAAVCESSNRIVQRMLRSVPGHVRVSIDLNYRSKLWKWAGGDRNVVHNAMWSMVKGAYLITGNETDFQDALGISGNKGGFEGIASVCFSRLRSLRYIAISQREQINASDNNWSGSLFVRSPGDRIKKFHSGIIKVSSIVDRVGTGDAFTAGIIYGLRSYPSQPQKVVDFAVKLSALKHTVRGDSSQFRAVDVESFFAGPCGKIQR